MCVCVCMYVTKWDKRVIKLQHLYFLYMILILFPKFLFQNFFFSNLTFIYHLS